MIQIEVSRAFRLGGFATGDYMNRCYACGDEFTGDKRALTCLPCAVDLVELRAAKDDSEIQPRAPEAERERPQDASKPLSNKETSDVG